MLSPKPPRLLLTQPTKFPPQNTSKSSPCIFRTHPMRSPKPRTYLNDLKTPVSVYLPQQKPQSPTPEGNSQNIRLPFQTHKKNLSLCCSFLWRDLFMTISVDRTTKSPKHSIVLPNSQYRQTATKTGLIPPAPKISILPTSQISKAAPNVSTTDMRNPRTNHRCAKLQILDWNSNFQLPSCSDHREVTTKFYSQKKNIYCKISFIMILFTIKFHSLKLFTK